MVILLNIKHSWHGLHTGGMLVSMCSVMSCGLYSVCQDTLELSIEARKILKAEKTSELHWLQSESFFCLILRTGNMHTFDTHLCSVKVRLFDIVQLICWQFVYIWWWHGLLVTYSMSGLVSVDCRQTDAISNPLSCRSAVSTFMHEAVEAC